MVEEITAAATVTPGYLLELTSAGKVQHHSTAGGRAVPMFALEDELQGKGISDNYSANDPVQVWIPYRGDIVYAMLKSGENVAIGARLESAGDGTLRALTSGGEPVAEAIEAVNASGGNTRIKVRIL